MAWVFDYYYDDRFDFDFDVEDDEPNAPEWYDADAYMPVDLETLWADAPEIPAPALIETPVYVFSDPIFTTTQEEAA